MSRPRKGLRSTESGRRRRRGSRRDRSSSPELASLPNVVSIPKAWPIGALLVVGLVTLIAFWPALDNEFVNWDDDKNIVTNEHFRGLGDAQLRWMFLEYKMGHYHPLTWVSLAIDFLDGGMDPRPYHRTSVLLHVLTALSVFWLAWILLRLARPPGSPGQARALCILSAWAALLFAVHPLRAESVAWVTERRDVLSGVFFVLCIGCYLRAWERPETPSWRWYILSLALLLLSLLSKAWGMVVPAVLLLLDLYPLRRIRRSTDPQSIRRTRVALADKVPYLLLAVPFMVLAYLAQKSEVGTMRSWEDHTLLERMAQAFNGLGFYLRKTVWPTGLIPIYELPKELSFLEFRFLASTAGVIVVAAVVVLLRKRWPALAVAAGAYFITLAPVMGITQSGPQLTADRYSYLSCLGWPILLAGTIAYSWQSSRLHRTVRILVAVLCIAVIPVLGVLTRRQADVWQSSMSLWNHTLAVDPNNWNAHLNRGLVLRKQGHDDQARAEYQRAVDLNPDSPIALNNLGFMLRRQGEKEKGLEYILRAKEIMPEHAGIRFSLARAYHVAGHLDEAVAAYRYYLKMKPLHFEGHYWFALALMDQGDFSEAQQELRRAVDLKSDSAPAYKALGDAFRHDGHFDEAIQQYRVAADFDPELAGLAGARAAAEAARR